MKQGIKKTLVMLLSLAMVFTMMAIPAYADDSAEPAAPEKILYYGDDVNFINAEGEPFGMLAPQEGTECMMDVDKIVIHYVPKTTTTYEGFSFGSVADPVYADEAAQPEIEFKANEDGSFDIEKVNFRSSFVEQIDKLYDKGVVDFPTMLERGGKLEDTRISVNMNIEQLQDYLSTLKKELAINYMDLGEYYFHDDKIDENYDNKSKVAMIRDRHIEFKLKKNQRVIRMVAIKQYKNFLAKPEGKLRLGLVTHTTTKKQHK